MTKILITGSEGLIGSATRIALEKSGFTVQGCDFRSCCETEKFDFRNSEKLSTILSDCDGVVHLGALSRVVWGQVYPELCRSINITGLRTLMAEIEKSPKKAWLIFASSREIYGTPPNLPCSSDMPPNPENLYAQTKLAGEQLVTDFRKRGFRAMVVRFSNVFGTTEDYHDRVVPAFTKASAHGDTLYVRGREVVSDFTPLVDAVEALVCAVQAINAGENDLPPIDIVTGRATSLIELAQIANVHGTSEIVIEERKSFYPMRFQGDPSPAKKYLGWAPKQNLENAVGKLVGDFKKLGNKRNAHIKSDSWISAAL